MTTDALSDIIAAVARAAEIDDPVTASVLRHTFEACLLWERTPAKVVSYLMGHSRRKAARAETAPYGDDLAEAIASLPAYAEPSSSSAGHWSDPVALAGVRDRQLGIIGELAVMNPEDTERQRDLATTYRKQGEAAAAAGEWDTARNAYEDSLRIATQLAASNPSNTERQYDVSIIYVKLGDVMAAMAARDLARARDYYQIGRSIIAELTAADPRNLHWQQEMQMISQRTTSVRTPHYPSHVGEPDMLALNLAAELATASTESRMIMPRGA